MKESYLNLIITIALIAYIFGIYIQNDNVNSFFTGLGYGICFGSFVYFLKRFKFFTSKNE